MRRSEESPEDAAAVGGPRLISTTQALRQGYDRAEALRLCRTGEWTRLRRGLYLPQPVASDADRFLAQAAAALAAIGREDAAIAHTSAGILLGAKWLAPPDRSVVWVACPVPGTPRYYPGLRILPAGLPPEDVENVIGLPVSSPARTIVDIGRHLPFRAAVVAADSLRRAHGVGEEELARVLAGCTRWPHVRKARRVVAFSDPLSESPLESLARVAFSAAGLPTPRLQVEVIDARGVKRRLDFLFGKNSSVEADGRVKYDDPAVLWAEKQREDDLREVGVHTLRITHADVTGDPAVLGARVRALMRRAGDL